MVIYYYYYLVFSVYHETHGFRFSRGPSYSITEKSQGIRAQPHAT